MAAKTLFLPMMEWSICFLSSDILAYVCVFIPSDKNIVDLFISCQRIQTSQLLDKINLKGTYQQSNCDEYKTLFKHWKRIRCWKLIQVADELPFGLQQLIFGRDFNRNIDHMRFPVTLKQLTFGVCFNQNIGKVRFPTMLQCLTFGHWFNQNIEHVNFPTGLQQLTFGDKFNQCINNVKFPSFLQRLTFGDNFNRCINHVKFPSSLQQLTFGFHFNQCINKVYIPASLQLLVIYHKRYVRNPDVPLASAYLTLINFKRNVKDDIKVLEKLLSGHQSRNPSSEFPRL
jgi:hypothetical protein